MTETSCWSEVGGGGTFSGKRVAAMTDKTPPSMIAGMLDGSKKEAQQASWNRFYDLYSPWLRSWVCRLTGYPLNNPDVDELANDVVAELWKQFAKQNYQYHEQTGSFRAYLKTTLIRRLQKYHQEKKRTQGNEVPELGSQLDNLADPHSELSSMLDKESILQRAKIEFSARDWECFERTFFHNQSVQTVVKEMDVTQDVVWKAKAKILKWLREEGKDLFS